MSGNPTQDGVFKSLARKLCIVFLAMAVGALVYATQTETEDNCRMVLADELKAYKTK